MHNIHNSSIFLPLIVQNDDVIWRLRRHFTAARHALEIRFYKCFLCLLNFQQKWNGCASKWKLIVEWSRMCFSCRSRKTENRFSIIFFFFLFRKMIIFRRLADFGHVACTSLGTRIERYRRFAFLLLSIVRDSHTHVRGNTFGKHNYSPFLHFWFIFRVVRKTARAFIPYTRRLSNQASRSVRLWNHEAVTKSQFKGGDSETKRKERE